MLRGSVSELLAASQPAEFSDGISDGSFRARKNGRKTTVRFKSDMEAPAYNNSAIAGLVLADAGDVIAFRWRRCGTADPVRLRVRFRKAATDSVEPRAFVALGVNGGFDRVHARHLASQATQFGANLTVESLEPGLALDGEIGKLARCP
jgi:hypothetical protein